MTARKDYKMPYSYHVGAAVLAHVAHSGQLDSALDERSLIACKSIRFLFTDIHFKEK